jgi:hypothetical protein
VFQDRASTPNTGFLDNLTVVANFDPADRLPPDPGTAPVPQGHVRLYHYTPLDNVPSIREHGLLFDHARSDAGNGDLTEPSAGVWASTNQPKDILSNHSGHAAVVEFHVHPDEISGNAESPWRAMNADRSYDPDKLREWNEGHHHVIIKGDVKPDRLVAIHEPWHGSARYMRDNGPLSSYDWVKEDYARGGNDHLEPYVRGLRALEGSVKGGVVSATAARYEPGLPNPHTGGGEWYHGSPYAFGEFGEGNNSPLEYEGDPHDTSHWNTLIGNHFAASHRMAEEFSKGEHGGDGHGEEGPAQNIVHARLELKNPRVYGSEHDMDQEAYEHEFRAGNHHDDYHDPDELADAREYGAEDELPRTYRYAGHGDRMRAQSEGDPEYAAMGHYHPYATRWLSDHPDKFGIAQRFRDRLAAQGHDGITYGNEFEKHHGTANQHHVCAIPFRASQVDVTQRHTGPDCIDEHSAARQWPGRDQPMLPGFSHEGGIEVTAHFEAERRPTYWDDLKPRIDAEHARTGEHERTVARMEAADGPDDKRYAYSGEGGHSCPSCKHWWEHEAHEDVSDMEPVSWGHLRKYGDPARGEECQYCNDRLTWPRPHTAAECGDTSECPSSMADILHGKDTLRLGPTDVIEEHWRHNHFDPRTPPHVEGDQPFTPDSTRHRHKWGTPDDWHAELAEHHELAGQERAEREAGHAIDQVFSAPEHDQAARFLEGNGGGSTHLSALEPAAEPHVPSFTWRYQTYGKGPEGGYTDEEREVSGPFYHGSRSKRLRPGSQVRPGMPTNSWGDEGPRSQRVHFTTSLAGARTYARDAGGHVYEVEPTGDVTMGYSGDEWKSEHPLRVIRRVPDEEEAMQAGTPALPEVVAHFGEGEHPHYIEQPARGLELRLHAGEHHPRLAPHAWNMSLEALDAEHHGEHGPGNFHPEPPAGGGEGHVHRREQAPEAAAPAGPQPPGHFEYYRGLDRDDARPRVTQLEDHLREHWVSENDVFRADEGTSHPGGGYNEAGHYTALDRLHRGAHAQGRQGGNTSMEAHHPTWQAEQDQAEEEKAAIREHRENGSAHFHGENMDFASAERHLREQHSIPEHAMPEYHLPTYSHHDTYAEHLEDAHNQDHGEAGSYRHDSDDDYADMHGQLVGEFDAERHLTEHHGFDLDDLRRDEPSMDEMTQMHQRSHQSDHSWLSHSQHARMDEEGMLPQDHTSHRDDDLHDHEAEGHYGIDEDYEPDEEGIHQEHWRRPGNIETRPEAPHEHDVDAGTAATYRYRPYAAAPRSDAELLEHMKTHHDARGFLDTSRPDMVRQAHDNAHFTSGTHQHEVPDDHIDPVFGSKVVAHFRKEERVTDGFSHLAAWEPQGRQDAAVTVRELPEVFLALGNGIARVAAALDEAPVHAAVRDAVHDLAAQAMRAARDADDLVSRLPTEAAWEDHPNR